MEKVTPQDLSINGASTLFWGQFTDFVKVKVKVNSLFMVLVSSASTIHLT